MADEKENFVHLHTHSSASLLDGAMGIESLVEEVARRGNPAVALTDHGTVRGHYRLTEMAEKHGVKPIYGAELYCVEDLESVGNGAPTEDEIAEVDDGKKTRDEAIAEARKKLDKIRYHITVWALNQAGLANLNRLSSKAWTHGFYYKPRVDLAMLREFSDGLAVGTGCRASLVNRPLSEKKPRVADSMLGKLVDIFGDRLRVEIMAHDTDGQRDANRFALIAISCGLRPVVTQDAHYLSEADSSHHEVLLAIGTHKSVGDEKGFKFDATSYWLKTRDELADSFRRYHGYIPGDVVERALDGTVELAGLCDAKIEINPLKGLLPSGLYPNGFKSDTEYFLHLIKQGMQWRDLPHLAEITAKYRGDEDVESIYQGYLRQIKHEFSVLKKSGFIPYFLMIYEICEWARDNGIMMGPGRGSAAGSIISFLLGITHVDPIYHGLMFERFIGIDRVNLPDIDLDFDDLRRDEIYQHLKDRYGVDHVSMIATSGRLNGKQAIRDVCRVLEIPYQEAEMAAGAIESDPEDKHEIRTALKRSEIFRKFAKDHPTAVKHADALEGLTKSLGVHAAGVIVSPVPVVEVAPVEIRDGDRDKIVTAFDMRGIEGVGLVKIDLLGLRTVRTLRLARDMIRARGVDIDLNTIPIDDPETLRGFTEHDFSGVFQFDSSSAHYVCDGINFREFKDLAAINALNRPGGISFVDEFKKRHEHPDKIGDVFHPKVSAITANAYGLMIYQEHVIRVATDVAGFSPGDADALRKKIGKKEGAASIEKLREQFVSGCLGTTPDLGHDGSNRLFDYIVKFSRYGFNLAHSVCYSLIAYHCMYLKRHYPTEFYCAILITEKDSKELQRFVVDAKNRYGISVVLPDVNKSGVGLSVTGDREISAALSDIKGVNERAAEHIVETRAAGGPFKSFVDFLSRTQRKLVRKNSVLALIQSGALDSVVKNPRWYSTEFERLWVAVDKKKYLQVEAAAGAANSSNWVWDTDTRLLIASEVCPIIAKPHPIVNFQSWLNENIDGVIEPITRELVTTKKNIFVAGAVDSVIARSVGDGMKYNQIPDEGEQEKMGFGRLWYYIVLRGITGETLKVKIDKSLVDTFPWVAITPSWEPVIVFGTVCPEWNYVDAHYIANLNNLVESVKNKGELSIWDRMFLRRSNPFALKKWKSATDGKIAVNGPKTLSSDRLRAVGIVSRAVEKTDRKGDKMGMLYLLVRRGAIRVLVFSDQWSTMKNYLLNGQLILSELEKLKGDAYSLISIKVFSREK